MLKNYESNHFWPYIFFFRFLAHALIFIASAIKTVTAVGFFTKQITA